jgi:CRP-like cAMP-binding protein
MRALLTHHPLSGCELFAGLPDEHLCRLGGLAERQVMAASTVLFRMGDVADKLYVLRRGRVLLSLPLCIEDTDLDLTVDERVPPQLLGWSALVPPHTSTLTARTLVESEMYVFYRGPLTAALREDPSVGLHVMSNLAGVMARRFHQTQALWMRELQRGIDARRF